LTGLKTQIEKLRAESAAFQARFEHELAAAKTPTAPQPVEASILLTPGRSRSDGSLRWEVSPQAEMIRFELVLPPDAPSGEYVITISTTGGGLVWSRGAMRSGHSLIQLAPAKLFRAGDYEIALRRLSAGEQAPDFATYSFRLIRK
jgi:hypothetical protein